MKKIFFPLPDRVVPAYYLELRSGDLVSKIDDALRLLGFTNVVRIAIASGVMTKDAILDTAVRVTESAMFARAINV